MMTAYVSTHTPQVKTNFFEYISPEYSTLINLLQHRARTQPNDIAYRFLDNGESEGESLTYYQVAERAKAIATRLQQAGEVGQRVLLVYSPGLDFITAFFGCLYAKAIAVPIYPPKRNQSRERLEAIIEDSGASIALTTRDWLDGFRDRPDQDAELSHLTWLATDCESIGDGDRWQNPEIDGHTLAFLQYTSGSTGSPKGVMVTHDNLLHNQRIIQQAFRHNEKSIGLGWLPLFHDMGLIGNVLQAIYLGSPCILMSPVDFLQKPVRWLRAISDYQATTSGGPNFAYDLCTRKITPEQMEGIDLSSWQIAFNGAEMIRSETLERFAEKFSAYGFRKKAFYPCYGMAESTLLIAGGVADRVPVIEAIDECSLAENRALPAIDGRNSTNMVGCGHTWDQKIRVVNPDTLISCREREVGEIWVSGPSVAQGYWGQSEKTTEIFQAYIHDTGEGPFLRTGDLGFLREDGELFITGRLKDVMIIRGRNHYPQDIERTVERSHHALIPDRCAAFSLEIQGEEKLIIAVEVERRYCDRRQGKENTQEEEKRKFQRRTESIDPGFEVALEQPPVYEEIISNIRQAVVANHGLQVHGVLLLRVGTIPKTSSGKIQRYACRKGFLEKTLTLIYNPHP